MYIQSRLIVLSGSLLPLALAQSIDPNSVDDSTKETWCTNQKSSCPLLCLQIPGATNKPRTNTCTASSLAFSCVCSNGQQPNASQYSQTIPYYECTEAATQCVNACSPNDSSCQSACRTDHPCGAQDPIRVNTSTISTMVATTTGVGAAQTGDATATGSVFGSQPTSGAGPNAQDLALGFGRTCGLAMILASVMAGFVFML